MKTALTIIPLLTVMAGVLTAGDLYTEDGKYDFYGLARYPEGGKLVEGVDLYEVKEGGGPADEYTRRVVDWWPRKGVDVIEVVKGMPLRTWTLRAGPLDPGIIKDLPEPTMVLRLADGTKRSIDGDNFCQQDREFIMEIYGREMDRIRASLDKTEYKVKPGTLREYPGGVKIGEPGTMITGRKI